MSKTPLMIGAIGVVAVLVLMLPVQGCAGDEGGIPPGGPDPNRASCSTLVFEYPTWGHTPGGEAGTDEAFTSADWVWRRMTVRALVASAVPLVLGLGMAWFLGRRSRTTGRAQRPLASRFLLGAAALVVLLLLVNFFLANPA